MQRTRLVLGIMISAILLLVGAQIIVAGIAYMPITLSQPRWLSTVQVGGLAAYAVGMAWFCGGLAVLANLSSNRSANHSAGLGTLRDVLLVAIGALFLIAVIAQIARIFGHGTL